jgi:outer membrane protein TolC
MQKYLYRLMVTISLMWLLPYLTYAQQEKIFAVETFISLIKANHPVAKQAAISVDKANAEILSARGGFDPVLDVDASRKTFDGKNYYNYYNPELKIPTPLPLDIKTGVEDNGGSFVSSETSKGKTSYLGVELALAKGFLIDKRRAALKQSKLFKSQTEQERKATINNLLFEAYTDYWQWAGAYQQFSVYNKFLDISSNRLRLIRIGFKNGERSLMDTIEAFTQVQNYQLMQAEAKLKWINATLQVSNYLC